VSSVLSAASGIAESVKFHQKLLGVPAEQPFRQYSRITVTVDDPTQASALNSGNQVLRTYDIVAARPANQRAFEQVCKNAEVRSTLSPGRKRQCGVVFWILNAKMKHEIGNMKFRVQGLGFRVWQGFEFRVLSALGEVWSWWKFYRGGVIEQFTDKW
jgi:hypothetical protein